MKSPERPRLKRGYHYGTVITSDDLRVGDVVVLEGQNVSYSGVSENPIARIGPKNIVIEIDDRHGHHEHRVPKTDVVYAARGKVVHPVEYAGRPVPRRPWD